jgi:hypothetical protein
MQTIKEGRSVYTSQKDTPPTASVIDHEHSHDVHRQIANQEPSPEARKTLMMLMRGTR